MACEQEREHRVGTEPNGVFDVGDLTGMAFVLRKAASRAAT